MPIPDPSLPERAPAPFNPLMMARSVIALPLLAQITTEQRTREKFEKDHPEILKRNNAAIFLHERYPEGPDAAYKEALKLLEQAATKLPEARKGRIDPPIQTREGSVCLALLTGRVARLLLSMDAVDPPLAIERIWPTLHDVIIEVNLSFKAREKIVAQFVPQEETRAKTLDSRAVAQRLIINAVKEAITRAKPNATLAKMAPGDDSQMVDELKTGLSTQYVFARVSGEVVQELVRIDAERAAEMAKAEVKFLKKNEPKPQAKARKKSDAPVVKKAAAEDLAAGFRTIHHIWPDFEIRSCITRSIATVKADAAHRSFTALGDKICWAVMDSGIKHDHPHFQTHQNVSKLSTYHADFSAPGADSALTDEFGHGTHVAGIIAGAQKRTADSEAKNFVAMFREKDPQTGVVEAKMQELPEISGMAPKCELVSLKVLDEFGQGKVSNLIAAIAHIQMINGHGRELHIHGVNISLGYPFDPKWFACGYSPICVEVNRLVKSGVVVVVAAGNTGYGTLQTAEGKSDACLDLTINDPGNAEEAITVGSTHRDMPHVYGVSFFSSKGPTGDGRFKPDLLAPGEKIVSCAAGRLGEQEGETMKCAYVETSGTSMAAPHVSGAIAAFLSIRREFIGETARVKQIFTATATDLRRDRYFQGAGLVDLMRAIQSV